MSVFDKLMFIIIRLFVIVLLGASLVYIIYGLWELL